MRCNFCGHAAERFQSFGAKNRAIAVHQIVGAGFRANAVCPRCWSSDRERLVALYLERHTALFEAGGLLLHVAPEPNLGRQLRGAAPIRYVSVDLDNQAVSAMLKMDLTRLAFASESFDAMVCNHVLEHIEHDVAAMRELYRVLVPGGWAILQVPISRINASTYEDGQWRSPAERARAFGQWDHVRVYGADYRDRLRGVGFDLEVLRAAEALGADAVREYALVGDEPIFCARRPRHAALQAEES
jgi:predicted SAM-dependent methyltransferase